MKSKILNLLLVITSLLGYLEWSGDSHSFIFEAEAEFFVKLLNNPIAALHPFTILPLAGQLLLLITLFQKTPSKRLTYIGIIGLGLLLGFMFIIGIISGHYKILFSTLPFLSVAAITIRHYRNHKATKEVN
jgi:hypothetical protein